MDKFRFKANVHHPAINGEKLKREGDKLKIISYSNFLKKYKIKKYSSSTLLNMTHNGFNRILSIVINYDDTHCKFTKKFAKVHNITEGLLVYRRIITVEGYKGIELYWKEKVDGV